MPFLTPLFFIAGLLAIPIILLYMLRLRRREVEVSSTFLWQQILQDKEANTPWQRLRRNLLLILQLIILTLLVLALMRPFLTVPAVSAGQIVLLLDASASMNATDINGESRFEEAKRRANELVDTLGAGDSITVVRVAEVPEVLTPATNNRELLRQVINDAEPSSARADWVAALTLASAGAANAEDFSIVVISDGGLREAEGLPIPGEVRYVPVGQSSDNVAITALATRALPGEQPQLFTQVTNYGSTDAEIIFSLNVDGAIFTAERYTVPANGELPLVSAALPAGFRTVRANITIPTDSNAIDYLEDDNTAWTVAAGSNSKRVLLLTDANLFLEQILRSLPTVEAFRGDLNRPLPANPFDLYVFDSFLPPTLPEGDLLIINPTRSTSLFTVSGATEEIGEITVNRSDERMTFVDFDDVDIRVIQQVEADWADELITAEGGALLLAGNVEGRRVAILTFDVHDSNLPLQIMWPIMIANLMDWYTPGQAVFSPETLNVGESLGIRPPLTADNVRIIMPDDSVTELPIDRETLVFAGATEPGIYTLEVVQEGEVTQSAPFAVNLFDAEESDITPRQSILLGESEIVESQQEEVGQREFWRWAAVLAILFLLVEWYAYHRRLRTPTLGRPIFRRRAAT